MSDSTVTLATVRAPGTAARRTRDHYVLAPTSTETLRVQLIEIEEELGVRQVRGLAHIDVLQEMARRARARRSLHTVGEPPTSAARHLLETGHELEYGCCAPRSGRRD